MRHDRVFPDPGTDDSGESCLTLLVLEAHGLHLQTYKFAMMSLAAATLPQTRPESVRDVRQILDAISLSWSKLRNARENLLSGCDPALIRIMSGAFSRDVDRTFECFETMAHAICGRLSGPSAPGPLDLAELVRFVTHELFQAIETIVTAARLVSETGSREVARLAVTDDLTGLPNRRALRRLLDEAAASGWSSDRVSILQVDLDRFKSINDTYGHPAGDLALKHATAAMARQIRASDFLARVGGDEFVLIFFDQVPDERLAERAEKLIAAVSEPFDYQGQTCQLGASVGIASVHRSDGIALERCLDNADMALHTAKNAGRGVYRFFAPHLRARFQEIEEPRGEIRAGIKAREFTPYFQPQIEGRTGRLIGFEALARWHHPKRGLLTPFHFLDAADADGLLAQLDRDLMDQTLAAMRLWIDAGLDIPQVSLNVTAMRLREPDLVDTLLRAVGAAGISPCIVGIEILESVLIHNESRQIIDNIRELSAAGFKVELDDFGTGHASISNLKNFKVDRIKIDRSFVKDVHLYSELAKITAAMIGLAHSLRVDALAEGVERPEERLVLNALGCDHIQGFGVARPMSASDIPVWMRKTQQIRQLSLPEARSGLLSRVADPTRAISPRPEATGAQTPSSSADGGREFLVHAVKEQSPDKLRRLS